MPKYSLIVPVYNVEKYIEACIDSILKQDYKDYEIIIVDDGSTDHSIEKIKRVLRYNKEKIKVIHQENKGLGGARNTGLHQAKGDYIWFIDSDDTIAPFALSYIDEVISKYQVDMLVFDRVNVNENGEQLESEEGVSFNHSNIFSLNVNPEMLFMSPSACNKIFNKNLFEKTNISFPNRVWFEDLYTVPKLYLHASKMGYINKALYLYLQRDGSIMRNTNVEKNNDIIGALDEVIEYYKKEKKYTEYFAEIEYLAIINVYLLTSIRVIKGDKKSKLLKKIKNYMKINFYNYDKNKYYCLIPPKYKLVLKLLDKEQYWLVDWLFRIKEKLKK